MITQMRALARVYPLVINPVIYAEIFLSFSTLEALDDVVSTMGLPMRELPRPALFLAAKAFALYRRRGGSRHLAGRLFGVSTSMSMPSSFSRSNRMEPISISVFSGVGSTGRSRLLSSLSSPRMAEPKTRTPVTRWLNAVSRVRVR